MRILITVGYQKILLGPQAGVEVLSAFDRAMIVNEKGGWNEPKKYAPEKPGEIFVNLIPDDSVLLPENTNESVDMFQRVAAETVQLKNKVRELEAALKAEKELKVIPVAEETI